MKTVLRAAVPLAAAISVLAAGGRTAAAHADGADTDRRVLAAIEAQPWVALEKGDKGYRVAAVRCLLAQIHRTACTPGASGADVFDDALVAAVREYQADRELVGTGTVNDETWVTLRTDHGIARQGDTRAQLVKGLQYSLNRLGAALAVDGVFGPRTATAVKNFQTRKEIDADGEVGPITFRALFAQGAESRSTPR